jgi:biotin transporter BioY
MDIARYRTHEFHKQYLKITAIVIGSFGPIFFLGTIMSTSEPARWTLDFLSWPIDGFQTFNDPTTRFLSGLTGGFLFGWGVMVWCLSSWVYDKAPDAVRKSIIIGLLSWFVLDSAGSIASGNGSNAIFNVVVLLIAAGPLWWKAKDVNSKK